MPRALVSGRSRPAESSPTRSRLQGPGQKISNPLAEGRGLDPGPSSLLNELKSEVKGQLVVGLENQSPGWHTGLLEMGSSIVFQQC